LFNWHKTNDGGLWLAGDYSDLDAIRSLQTHPWVSEDSDDEEVVGDNESCTAVDKDWIENWQLDVSGRDSYCLEGAVLTPAS
jgi:hypothetical protein